MSAAAVSQSIVSAAAAAAQHCLFSCVYVMASAIPVTAIDDCFTVNSTGKAQEWLRIRLGHNESAGFVLHIVYAAVNDLFSLSVQ